MGVPEIVQPDLLHSRRRAAVRHLMVEIAFREREQPILRVWLIQRIHVFLDLIAELWRDRHHALTPGSFRLRDDLFPFDHLEGLIHRKGLRLQVDIAGGELIWEKATKQPPSASLRDSW